MGVLKTWIAHKLAAWSGASVTREIATQYIKRVHAAPPPRPARADATLSERPDLARRRAFFQDHILVHTHIPKTAGTSLSAGLASIVGGIHFMDLRHERTPSLTALTREDMDDIYCISSHMGFGLHELFDRTPLYIASVRDPVERAVSFYRYLQNRPTHPMAKNVIGLSFEDSWHAISAVRGESHHNLQSRMLVSAVDSKPLDPALVWRRVEEDYFLITPSSKVSKSVDRLRAAFGAFKTPHARVNVSRSEEIDPSRDIKAKILAVNQVDEELYRYVVANFEDNLDRACKTIARQCLQPLEAG